MRILGALASALLLLIGFSSSALAATITVNTLVDENNVGANCSLREAMVAANGNAAFGGCSAGSGTDTINISVNGTINLTAPLPAITSSMTISGNGANLLTVRRDTGGNYRIFNIPNTGLSVEFARMTIANGRESAGGASGGGISSVSDLTLTNVHMTGNFATVGTAVEIRNATGLITGSTFSGNNGFQAVIAIKVTSGTGRTTRIINTTVSENSTGQNAILNESIVVPSDLILENCTITDNTATNGSAILTVASSSGRAVTRLKNVIVAGNTPGNLSNAQDTGGVSETQTQGFNLSNNFNGAFTLASTDIVAANPGLGPLAINGGSTPTRALLLSSPALDKGGASNFTDQRGLPRPVDIASIAPAAGGDNTDIGAFELNAIEVSNTNDSGSGSLRAAIAAAASNGPAVDEIVFIASVFNTPRTITLTTGELFISSSLNVLGLGANLLTVSGNNVSRVFQVGPGATVGLSGMTITGGNAGGDGGGVYNDGTLSVSNANIIGNRAGFNGGGIGAGSGDSVTVSYSTIASNSAQTAGGIIANGNLSVTRSTISGNAALFGTGGILAQNGGTLNMQNATVTANRVNAANGISGVFVVSGSTAFIGNSIIAANVDNSSKPDTSGTGFTSQGFNRIGNPGSVSFPQSSDSVGDGAQPLDPRLAPLSNYGGTTLTHALLGDSPALDRGNNASLDQRGLPLFDIAGFGSGNQSDIGAFEAQAILVTNANDSNTGSLRAAVLAAAARAGLEDILFSSIFGNPQTILLTSDQILIDADLNIVGPGANLLTVSGNNARRVFQVASNRSASLVGMRITGGNADNGGGIRNDGRLIVSHATINGNTASNFGGGIFGPGGVVTTVASSTLSGNTANANGGTAGAIDHSGDLTVTDSTISGNSAPAGNTNGGGLWIGGVGEIVNTTVTNNSTVGAGSASGVYVSSTSPASVRNSIIAGNSNNATLPDVLGSGMASLGFNLIGNRGAVSFASTGDQSGTGAAPLNPLLGALQNNGGTMATHAMLTGSPALDKGNRSGATVDQRGDLRPFDFAAISNAADGSDIGAFEVQVTTDPIPTASASAPNVTAPAPNAPVFYQVSVTYADDTAINVSTIDASDLVVIQPDGGSATPNSVSVAGGNGTPRTAIYTLTAPGSIWSISSNGTYTISMRANQVSDVAGLFVQPGQIGAFTVNIQPVAPTVSYTPAAGSTINFPAGPAGNADSDINIQSSGGLAPGSVTVNGGTPSGFTFLSGQPPFSGTPSFPISVNSRLRCVRGASAQTATLILTETPSPGSPVQRSWTLNCPAAEVSTPPALAFSPTVGSTISYSTAGTASAIAVTPSAGSGSGAAATTTLGACTISNGGAAFPTTTIAQLSFVGAATTAQSLNLPSCVPQSAAVNATLTCPETRGAGAPVNRTWTLNCPATSPTPAAPAVAYAPAAGSVINFPSGAAGTATSSIAVSSSGGVAPGAVNVASCSTPAGFTITNSPINLTGTAGGAQISGNINLSCTRGASLQTGTLSCSETPTPGTAVTRSWTLSCPAAAADLIFGNGFE